MNRPAMDIVPSGPPTRSWVLFALLSGHVLGCGSPTASLPSDTPAEDTVGAPDVSDTLAPPDGDANPPADAIFEDDLAEPDTRAPDGEGPNCPDCPENSLCRPDREACVGAGLVRCEPACASATSCGLTGACVLTTCAPRDRFPARVLKLTTLAIPIDSGCGGGSQTALGRLVERLPFVAALLEEAVRTDRATLLLEPAGFPQEGGAGQLTWLFGTRAPDSLRCDPAAAAAFCTYTASRDSWDPTTPGTGPCDAWLVSRAVHTPDVGPAGSGRLSGGGMFAETPQAAGDLMQFAIPVGAGGRVLLQLHRPAVEARATLDPANPTAVGAPGFVSLSGRLCGSIPMESLRAALAALPADVLDVVGGLAIAESLLADNLVADVDLDGDGVFDAASAVLAFEATRARLSGFSP
jgi:hypothetical protein